MVYDYPELMGGTVGGIVEFMKAAMKGIGEIQYVNSRNVENMLREYHALLTEGYRPPEIILRPAQYAVKWSKQDYEMSKKIAERLNIPQIVVLNFFLAIYDLSAQGKIAYKDYNPQQVKESKKKIESVTGKPWYKKIGESAVTGTTATLKIVPIIVTGAAFFGLWLLSKQDFTKK